MIRRYAMACSELRCELYAVAVWHDLDVDDLLEGDLAGGPRCTLCGLLLQILMAREVSA